MYAHLSTSHFPLADKLDVEANLMNDRMVVRASLSHNLCLSFEPAEARRFAETLIEAATEAEKAQGRIDAAAPVREEAKV